MLYSPVTTGFYRIINQMLLLSYVFKLLYFLQLDHETRDSMPYQTDEKIQTNSSNSCIKLVTEQAIVIFHRLCPVFDHQTWIIANMN